MNFKSYIFFFCLSFCLFPAHLFAQITISGTVYDSTKSVPVKNVLVTCNCGTSTITDSLGRYEIVVGEKDSLVFSYRNKNTEKFSVKQIKVLNDSNISLHIRIDEKFKTMKEVRVFTRTYRQDSLDNRNSYSKIFSYDKPGIKTTSSSYSGTPGLDLDELINVFRFKRNKQLQTLQRRLISQEKEKFVDYRFNKTLVRRITGITDKDLDDFMILYRPTYEFAQIASTTDFYQYILDCSYAYKKEVLKTQLKK